MPATKMTRRRHRKPGDIAALRRTLWAALLTLEDVLDGGDPNDTIRASHALASLSGVYLKSLEIAELVPRLEALEAQLADQPSPIRRVS